MKDYYSPYLTVGDTNNEYINCCLAEIFKEIGFEGIFECEFLIDQNGTMYFDEINFRNSLWSYPSAALERCLPELWMQSMLAGEIVCTSVDVPKNFTAMIEPVDYSKRVESGLITEAEWLADFKAANVTFYYDRVDLAPYYLMMRKREYYS